MSFHSTEIIFFWGGEGKVHSLAALDFSGEVKWGEVVLTLLFKSRLFNRLATQLADDADIKGWQPHLLDLNLQSSLLTK